MIVPVKHMKWIRNRIIHIPLLIFHKLILKNILTPYYKEEKDYNEDVKIYIFERD